MSEVGAVGLTLTASRRIRRISVATVVVLAISAAVLSFSGLRALALEAGYPPMLAWMFPVVVDGLVLAGSLGVISAALARVKTTYFWFLTLLGVFISVVGNIASAPEDFLSQAVHAAPPLIFALSVEGLLKVYRHAAIQRTTSLEPDTHRGMEMPSREDEEPPVLGVVEVPVRDVYVGAVSEVSPPAEVERALVGERQGTARERLQQLLIEEPEISGAAAARALGIDPSHARRLLRDLRSSRPH